ncbi:hypothetical protein CTAYLR_010234 [Chrysophaeum taylorii]|uniref:Uncharacterized protein n=1 Tax=Chrysophaeum taylorii TaxID=2483200 RepID=A0AAD7XF29_9STRA|nr:hypothetical protein CTAYLR_010234 [Chrysophaeum taylorii]
MTALIAFAAAEGVVVWSLGRCATATFGQSLRESGGLRYCRNRKESFSSGVSARSLAKCMRSDVALSHIKPQHLIVEKSRLRTPEAFAAAADKAGFRIAVVIRRQNHLARLVSSYENRLKERGWRVESRRAARLSAFFFQTPRRTMEWEAAWLNRGTRALEARMAVRAFDFDYLTGHICDCVAQVLSLLGKNTSSCRIRVSHVASSQRHLDLEGRVGRKAAAHLRSELQGTPYAWMLNLSATTWPPTVPKPDPRAHPAGPRPPPVFDKGTFIIR